MVRFIIVKSQSYFLSRTSTVAKKFTNAFIALAILVLAFIIKPSFYSLMWVTILYAHLAVIMIYHMPKAF